MKITFVQNDKEKEESDQAIRAGLSLGKAKVGTWILPPAITFSHKFVVVDSPDGREVYVESFDTIDGALMYALGIKDCVKTKDSPAAVADWDRHGSLKEWGNFV